MERTEVLRILESQTLPASQKEAPDAAAKAVWEAVFAFARNDSASLRSVFPLLSEYSRKERAFAASCPQEINDYFAKIDAENFVSIKESFSIVPFMKTEFLQVFLEKAASAAQILFDKTLNLPSDFVSAMELIDFSLVRSHDLDALFVFVQTFLKSSDNYGKVFVSSFFAAEMSESVDKSGDFFVSVVIEALKGKKQEQIAGLFLLSKLSLFLSEEQEKYQNELFKAVLPFIVSEDEALYRVSNKTMVKLVKAGVFCSHLQVIEIIKCYSKYKDNKVIDFFKIIEKYLEDTESVTIPVAQPIYNLLGLVSKRSSTLTKALCLEAYSLLAAVKKDVIEEVYEQELEIALDLLKSNEALILSKISCFVSTLSKSIPETFTQLLKDYVPSLLIHLSTESQREDRKYLLDIAQTLAAFIEGGSYPAISGKIVDFILFALSDVKGGEIFYIASVVITLGSQLTSEQGKILFQKFATYMMAATSQTSVNVVLKVMKKLISKQQIDPKIVLDVAEKVMNGKPYMLYNLPPYQSSNRKSMFFYFMTSIIKNYPNNCIDVVRLMITWIPKTCVVLLPSLLEPLRKALDFVVLPDNLIQDFYSSLTQLLGLISPQSDEEMYSVISCIIHIITKYPAFCDGNELLRLSTETLARCHQYMANDSNDDDDEEEEEQAPIQLSCLVLTIYSLTSIPADINKELISNVLNEIGLDLTPTSFNLIIAMLKQGDRFKTVYVPLCKSIMDIIFMKKQELAEIGIEQKDVDSAKTIIKSIFRANKLAKKQIQKDFSSSSQKLNRFNALFK